MNINFIYCKEKDIWCLLNKGKSSNNSSNPTKQYELLVAECGDNPTQNDTATFIDKYITQNKIDVRKYAENFQTDWEIISNEFQKRAETIFGINLPANITAYLTINSRCPYNIKENLFYVPLSPNQVRKTAMHELWHFYTWYGLGVDQEEKLGKEKYNELKEALTVLLNVECGDLLPEEIIDTGYPQHQELREKILDHWRKDKNIQNLWGHLVE